MSAALRTGETVVGWEEAVAEVSLLLDVSQAAALEQEANRRGLTMGQMVRGLVRVFLQAKGWGREGAEKGGRLPG